MKEREGMEREERERKEGRRQGRKEGERKGYREEGKDRLSTHQRHRNLFREWELEPFCFLQL